LLKVRVYREKVGLSHGDQVYLEPDTESAIVMPASDVAETPLPVPEPRTADHAAPVG
jgi:hypothetical protein